MVSPQQKQVLVAVKPLLAELIGLLDTLAQAQDKQPLIEELRRYGITLLPGAFTFEQLERILAAIRTTANRLLEIAQGCGYSVTTPEEVFIKVYGDHPIDLRYDPNAEFAKTSDENNTQEYVILAPSTFVKPTGEPYSDKIIEEIIIHELGHAFHDALEALEGEAADYSFSDPQAHIVKVNPNGSYVVTIPEVTLEERVYTNLTITVTGDTPLVTVDYLIATGGYWSGNVGLEFGDSLPAGRYTLEDAKLNPSIVPLTKRLYEENIGISNCTDCPITALVDRNGQCIKRSNGTCVIVTDTDASERAVYVRKPAYYALGGVPDEKFEGKVYQDFVKNFTNEFVPPGKTEATTLAPQPNEGFADTFKVEITESMNISSNKRGQFFEERWCVWLGQLLA